MVVSRYVWGGMRKETGEAKERKKKDTNRHPTIPKQYRLLQEKNGSIIFNNIQKKLLFLKVKKHQWDENKYIKFPSRCTSVTNFQDNKKLQSKRPQNRRSTFPAGASQRREQL